MKSYSVPPKNRPEWRKLVRGEIVHKFRNYILQINIYQSQKDIADNKITEGQAIDSLYELCSKYVLAVQLDLKEIFKTW